MTAPTNPPAGLTAEQIAAKPSRIIPATEAGEFYQLHHGSVSGGLLRCWLRIMNAGGDGYRWRSGMYDDRTRAESDLAKVIRRQVRAARDGYELAPLLGWHYSGDVSLEYGGIFTKDTGDSLVEAVEVFDDTNDGGEGNTVAHGSIYLRSSQEDITSALETCGWESRWDTDGELVSCEQGGEVEDTPEGLRRLTIDAMHATWGIEREGECKAPCDEENLLGYVAAKFLSE